MRARRCRRLPPPSGTAFRIAEPVGSRTTPLSVADAQPLQRVRSSARRSAICTGPTSPPLAALTDRRTPSRQRDEVLAGRQLVEHAPRRVGGLDDDDAEEDGGLSVRTEAASAHGTRAAIEQCGQPSARRGSSSGSPFLAAQYGQPFGSSSCGSAPHHHASIRRSWLSLDRVRDGRASLGGIAGSRRRRSGDRRARRRSARSGHRPRQPLAPAFRDVAAHAPDSISCTSTAPATRNSSRKSWGRAASSSTSTTTAGSTCFSWTAARSPIRRWPRRARHRLYRNRRNGTFEDVTAASGIRHRDYGMGACAGDFDNDGLIDLYITNVGPNRSIAMPAADGLPRSPRPAAPTAALEHELRVRRHRSRRRPRPLRDQLRGPSRKDRPQKRVERFCGVAGPPPIRDYCHPLIYRRR